MEKEICVNSYLIVYKLFFNALEKISNFTLETSRLELKYS